MLTIHVWPKRLKEFLLTHTLYKSPAVQVQAGRASKSQDPRPFCPATFRIGVLGPYTSNP